MAVLTLTNSATNLLATAIMAVLHWLQWITQETRINPIALGSSGWPRQVYEMSSVTGICTEKLHFVNESSDKDLKTDHNFRSNDSYRKRYIL